MTIVPVLVLALVGQRLIDAVADESDSLTTEVDRVVRLHTAPVQADAAGEVEGTDDLFSWVETAIAIEIDKAADAPMPALLTVPLL